MLVAAVLVLVVEVLVVAVVLDNVWICLKHLGVDIQQNNTTKQDVVDQN